MEIICRFESHQVIDSRDRYFCIVEKAFIMEENHVIKEFKGNHFGGKSHIDVEIVTFCDVNYIPRGLEKHFPNLTHLQINGSGIKKISKNDLKGLEGLVLLAIGRTELTTLPDDLFTEMPKLHEISVCNNYKLEFASSELLKPLLGRENVMVILRGNKNINAAFWPGNFGSLESLEELMKLIDEKSIKPTPKQYDPANLILKELWISGKFSDLTIIAGEKKFKVHKNILGVKSELFDIKFEDQNEASEMKILDFSSKSVEALLKFIYMNEVLADGSAKENFEIADKFKVAAMKSICEKMVFEQVDYSNAWETFLFAHRFSSQLLKERAFHQIVKEIPEEVPDELMEDPENLKKLIDHRRAYEEILLKAKKLNIDKK